MRRWMDGCKDRWMGGQVDDELPVMHSVVGSNQQLESQAGGAPPGKCMVLPKGCTCHVSVSRMWVGTRWFP
jgi:hypothetical protein